MEEENDLVEYCQELDKKIKSLLTKYINEGFNEFEVTDEFDPLFNELYYKSNDCNYYWKYCTLKVYQNTFEKRLQSYINEFPDAHTIDFANEEMKSQDITDEYPNEYYHEYIDPENNYPVLYKLIYPQTLKRVLYSNEKKLEFLKSIQKNHESDFESSYSLNDYPLIEWRGNNVELVELIKSLIESKKLEIDLTEKEIYRRFSVFFKTNIDNKKGIQNIRERVNRGGELAKFINELSVSLTSWISKLEK